MRMTTRDWGLLLLLSVLWGGSFFFVSVAVRDLPPLTLVVLRTGIAALALAAVLKLRGLAWPFAEGRAGAFLVMGLLNNLLPFSLLFWAQTVIPGSLASILNAATPIFSVVVAHFALADEPLAAHKAGGVALGFLGVAVLLGADLVGGADIAFAGMAACLCAALSYGIAGVYGRRFGPTGLRPVQVAFGQLAATTGMMIPVVALIDLPAGLPAPGLAAVGATLALALLSTAFAYVIFFRILASAGAVNVTLVTLLVPVSAIMLGTFILGEALAARHFLGMGLISAGLLVIDGRLSKGFKRG